MHNTFQIAFPILQNNLGASPFQMFRLDWSSKIQVNLDNFHSLNLCLFHSVGLETMKKKYLLDLMMHQVSFWIKFYFLLQCIQQLRNKIVAFLVFIEQQYFQIHDRLRRTNFSDETKGEQ